MPTILSEISFELESHENLRTLALFAGGINIAELEVAENIINNTLSFAELSIVATSGMSKAVNVRATFGEDVDDGEQIELTISAVTAAASGSSTFAAGDGAPSGGSAATTDITTSSDVNAIVVTATALAITAPKVALVSQDFKLTVTVVDDFDNTDVGDREVTLSHSGSGTLTSTAGLVATLASGVYTWSDLQYDEEEAITLTVTDNAGSLPLTAVTSENIEVTAVATITTVFFPEYIEGSAHNKALEIYNGSGSTINLSEFSISGYNDGVPTVVATYTLSGTLNAGEVYVIGNVASGSGIRNERDVADFSVTNFYGNYAIALLHNGVIVDFIGGNDGDPGIGWDVVGTAEATANHPLVRKPRVTEGNPTPLDSFGTVFVFVYLYLTYILKIVLW